MKIALITGAGIRIGKGIAGSMLASGYHLILHAHSSITELKDWVKCHPLKDQVLAIVCADLSSEAGQNQLSDEVSRKIPYLNVLVNNASIFSPVPFANIDRECFHQMQAINLDAPFFITQSLLPLLRKAANASVINIVDALWKRPSPQYSHYAVSKAGLAILTRALALELAPKIRVNAVAPGAILFAPFVKEESKKRIIQKIPLKRLGTVEDIGNAVVFLTQDSCSMSGEILVVDGGRSLIL